MGNRARLSKWALATYFVLFTAVLYLPAILMAILSFQGERGSPYFPMQGFSGHWRWGSTATILSCGTRQAIWPTCYEHVCSVGIQWSAMIAGGPGSCSLQLRPCQTSIRSCRYLMGLSIFGERFCNAHSELGATLRRPK